MFKKILLKICTYTSGLLIVSVCLILITSKLYGVEKGETEKDKFEIVALGTQGGVYSDNLSAFLIGLEDQAYSVACDAGTLLTGIERTINKGNFAQLPVPKDYDLSDTGYVLREHIKAYLISHAHLDHIAGLIIASPEDTKKPIYALDGTIQTLVNHYFNWQAWPNFGNQGLQPQLKKYAFTSLKPGKWLSIPNTAFRVSALPLSHSGRVSTAFVVKHKQDLIVCVGDTGPDSVENTDNLKALWQFISPSVSEGHLKAIIIESSFTNETPDNKLFGHLNPKYVNQTLLTLSEEIDAPEILMDLPVIISHIKPSLQKGMKVEQQVLEQLQSNNPLKVNYILPKQGQRIKLGSLHRK